MAVISPSSFDALRSYVNVRLAQGVPIADADWNELDDIRKFELRAFLKWFVGDGVPSNPVDPTLPYDGFRIAVAAAPANDFTILSGVTGPPSGLANAGRCLVDGMEILIAADLKFTDQPLHAGKGASAAALAAKLGVPVIDAIATPAGPGTLTIYLDVWEHLVTPTDDPGLVLAGLGTETCSRIKREWVARARTAAGAPQPGDADFIAGHSYLAMAGVTRRAADPNINAADIQDQRRSRVTLVDANARLSKLEQFLLLPVFTPSPLQFSPKSGPNGTQVVTLHGRNLMLGFNPPKVFFGATAATIAPAPPNPVSTPTALVVVVPAMAPGVVKISVQTDGGSVVSDDTFTVT